jgi:uncharacterized protein (UPF0276 family)
MQEAVSSSGCLGFGLGLRPQYYQEILDGPTAVDWFEIISENYMIPGGRPLAMLDRIRADYPVVMHGVSMSLGSTDPLDIDYLRQLKELARRVEPAWISDHLAWTGVGGVNIHDLLPVPYTEETLEHVADRVKQAQDFLGRRLVIENPSSYIAFEESDMDECTFLAELACRADCLLLLDVNNVFVSAHNHGFDPNEYIEAIPASRVAQIHLAGHIDRQICKVDTHDQPVCEDVWSLYALARRRFGPVPAMIERDGSFPPFSELLAELGRMREVAAVADGLRRSAA